MNYKHITTIAILAAVIIPSTVFAQQNIELKKGLKAPQAKANIESQIHKNRIERVNFALKAIDGNISIIEKAITQTTIKTENLDSSRKDVASIKEDLEKAKVKITEAKNVIAAAKEFVSKMDTSNKDDVQTVRSKIDEARKLLHEAIVITKNAVKRLKMIKVPTVMRGANVIEIKK